MIFGVAGAFVGAMPTIVSFLGTYFTFGSGAMAISVSGAQIATGAAIGALGMYIFSKRTGKESASDKPSWVNKDMVDFGKTAQQNATEILNNKYGKGKWKTGPATEYNKIVKWIIIKIFYGR